MQKGFSIGAMLKFGWHQMKTHMSLFIGVLLFSFILLQIPFGILTLFQGGREETIRIAVLLCVLLGLLIGTLTYSGLTHIALKLAKGEEVNFWDFFLKPTILLKVFFGFFLYILVVIVGLVFFIVPGIIIAMRYWMFAYCIIENNVGPIVALRQSAKITDGAKWDIFALSYMMPLVIYIGFLCFIIGLFATIPTALVAQLRAYRTLVEQTIH